MAEERYDEAAARHFADARHLASAQPPGLDGAGHLIGFAAECAIKHAVRAVRPAAQAPHLHLPELVEAAKKVLRGTRHRPLLEVFSHAEYFADWVVKARYFANGHVTQQKYDAWETSARRTLAAAGIRGRSDV